MGQAEVKAKVGLETAGFSAGLKGIQRETEAWSSGQLRALKSQITGAFSVGALISFGKSVVETAKQLDDEAETLNVTTDALQALNIEARKSGIDHEKLAAALTKTQNAQMDLLSGSEKTTAAFKALGIEAKDVAGLGTDEVFALIADKVAETSDETAAYESVAQILGDKLAGKLIPTLKAVGEDGLQTIIDKSKESGQILDSAFIAQVKASSEQLDAFGQKATVFFAHIVEGLEVTWRGVATFFKALWHGTDPSEAFAQAKKAMDDLAVKITEQIDASVAKQREGNERIKESSAAATLKQITDVTKVGDTHEREAKRSADAWERYEERVDKRRMAGLSAEDQIVELRSKQHDLLEKIGELESAGVTRSDELLKLKTDLLDVQDDLTRAEKGTAKSSESVTSAIKDSKDEAAGLRTEIGKMNVFEVGTLIKNMHVLQAGLKEISAAGGFPEIEIPDLSGLTLPEWMTKGNSVDKVRNFIDALAGLARGLAAGKFEELEKLQNLKFEVPDTSKTDLKGLAELLKATKDAQFGSLMINVDYPEAGIPIDASNLKLDSIEESLAELAAMKGIIWA